jgi:hypothetical protein
MYANPAEISALENFFANPGCQVWVLMLPSPLILEVIHLNKLFEAMP